MPRTGSANRRYEGRRLRQALKKNTSLQLLAFPVGVLVIVLIYSGLRMRDFLADEVFISQKNTEAPIFETYQWPEDFSLESFYNPTLEKNGSCSSLLGSSYMDHTVVVTPERLIILGKPDGPFTYAYKTETRVTDGTYVFLVEGALFEGGIEVGVLKDGSWLHKILIKEGSRFSVFLRPPAGNVSLAVAHSLFEKNLYNDVTITRLCWASDGVQSRSPSF